MGHTKMGERMRQSRSAWPSSGLVTAALLAAGAAAATAAPTPLAAQQSGADDQAAVLAVVDRLFDGMRAKDEALLRGVWHPEARLQNAGRDAEGRPVLRSTPVEAFITSVLSGDRVLDEVTFDEVVRISGDLATVWAPYNLFVDGDFSHCGVDAIQMVRTPDGWLMHQLTDTRMQQGCDPDRGRDGA